MKNAAADSEPFKKKVARVSNENASRIILAIDVGCGHSESDFRRVRVLLEKTVPYLCGVKLGRQTVLNLGTNRIAKVTKLIHRRGLPCIVDDKLNDIGPTNIAIADSYFRFGFDALTANPLAGWEGGLQPLFSIAHKKGKGVILLVYMSHPGASEGYGQTVLERSKLKPQYVSFAQKAVEWKADGTVVGATRPEVVKQVRRVLGRRVPIYSPGVGVQGGDLKRALSMGTDYFIIGRSITENSSPLTAASKFARLSMG